MIWSQVNFESKASEDTVLGSGRDAGQIEDVNHDQEQAEYAANHQQAPRHLMRALVLLADCAELRMRKHTASNQCGG